MQLQAHVPRRFQITGSRPSPPRRCA